MEKPPISGSNALLGGYGLGEGLPETAWCVLRGVLRHYRILGVCGGFRFTMNTGRWPQLPSEMFTGYRGFFDKLCAEW